MNEESVFEGAKENGERERVGDSRRERNIADALTPLSFT